MEVPQEVWDALQNVHLEIVALPGVNGVGVGPREERGEITEELVIRVLVDSTDDIPPGIPDEIAGVPVCYISRRYHPMGLPDMERYDPLRGGVRIETGGEVGTLGAIVKDNQTGGAVGLTNFHVSGPPGHAFPDNIWQPARAVSFIGHPPDPADNVGDVLRVVFPQTPVPVVAPTVVGVADAAIVSLTEAVTHGRFLSAAIAGLGSTAPDLIGAVTATAPPTIGARVRKRGFVTGTTAGSLIAPLASVPWTPGGPNAFLLNQWEILGDSTFAQKGDSGSLVLLENSATAVGLLWAATGPAEFAPTGHLAIMTPIGVVEQQLGVSIVL